MALIELPHLPPPTSCSPFLLSLCSLSSLLSTSPSTSPNQGSPDSPSSVMDHRLRPRPPGLQGKSRPPQPPSHSPAPYSPALLSFLLLHQ